MASNNKSSRLPHDVYTIVKLDGNEREVISVWTTMDLAMTWEGILNEKVPKYKYIIESYPLNYQLEVE
jgi:hypothetical protein